MRPLTPYPAHICLPGPSEQQRLHCALRTAFRLHHHLPSWAICGPGPLFGCRDAPHCPAAAAEAAAAVAWLRDGGWGPEALSAKQAAL